MLLSHSGLNQCFCAIIFIDATEKHVALLKNGCQDFLFLKPCLYVSGTSEFVNCNHFRKPSDHTNVLFVIGKLVVL